jgi:sugar phosphate isomerase/epimerase
MKTRREFLSIAAGSLFLADAATLLGAEEKTPWKIGICDWDLRAAGQMAAFAVAKELGFDGVQVSFQPDGNNSLANKENRPKFLATAKEANVAIPSFCIGLMNERPLATTREAEGWIENCLDAMEEMKIDRVLIPFFGNADINQHKDQLQPTIEKLKRLAPIAEKKKKILALESYLSAEDNLKLIDAIGSDAVKVYYDVRNSRNKDYDIFREMALLGSKKLIAEIHFKEDSTRLGDGEIDFIKVCATLEKADYNGWVVVESSAPGNWKESHTANVQFVKKVVGSVNRLHGR